jgi:DNA-binding NarL/FixJ family response regulator
MEPADQHDPNPRLVQRTDSTKRDGILRLLHVEDNPSDAVLMQEYIRSACQQWDISLSDASMAMFLPEPLQVEFDTAERLSDLTSARAAAADCAIVDLSLPDAEGLDALVVLRSMSGDLPIVVLTGFDDLEVGLTALRNGADDYLIKSKVDGSSLDRAVRYAIARRQLTRESAAAAAAATITTANSILAHAGLPEVPGIGAAGAVRGRRHEVATGTHRVTVQIERTTGEYALVCESCTWEALRGPGEPHSWEERGLDAVLLQHVTFGEQASDVAGF